MLGAGFASPTLLAMPAELDHGDVGGARLLFGVVDVLYYLAQRPDLPLGYPPLGQDAADAGPLL